MQLASLSLVSSSLVIIIFYTGTTQACLCSLLIAAGKFKKDPFRGCGEIDVLFEKAYTSLWNKAYLRTVEKN